MIIIRYNYLSDPDQILQCKDIKCNDEDFEANYKIAQNETCNVNTITVYSVPNEAEEPTQLDKLEAQVTYNSIVSGTILINSVTFDLRNNPMKDNITKWYKQGLWPAEAVMTAVDKGFLNIDEYNEIVS